VALGGIRVDRVGDVVNAGAAGIAVIQAIFGATDVEAAARALRSAIDSHLRLDPGRR
jgi:thiamine monophosphate synthase